MSGREGRGPGGGWLLWLSLSLIVLDLLLLAGVGLLACGILVEERAAWRGVAVGTPPFVPRAQDKSLGVHLNLAELEGSSARRRALERVRDMGVRWVRLEFPWSDIEPLPGEWDWTLWDELVEDFGRERLEVVAVLKSSPLWVRLPRDRNFEEAPPADLEDFSRFARAVAARYRGRISAYQIWDEPNIYPHWGERFVDPEGYARMLIGASTAIRSEDPQALILTASLAPNVEDGPINMNEVLFLERMYEGGAGPYFDVLALEPYGFWTGPDDRRVDPGVLNFSRALLGRETMIRHGDTEKAVWAMAFGWNSLPRDWESHPSPWGTDEEKVQAKRVREAVRRARTEWPWMGPMFWPRLSPPPDVGDPAGGFALVDRSGQPRLAYAALRALVAFSSAAHVGWIEPGSLAVQLDDGWVFQGDGVRASRADAELDMSFYGTRLDTLWSTGPEGGSYDVWVDGEPAGELPDSHLDLGDPIEQERRLTVVRDLPFGLHTVRLMGRDVAASRLLGFVIILEVGPTSLGWALGLAAVGLGLMLWRLGMDLARLPLREWMRGVSRAYLSLSEGWQIAAMAAVVLLLQFVPVLPIQLVALVGLMGLVWLRLDLGLAFLVLAVPFFLQPVRFGPKAFSLVEILTILSSGVWFSQTLTRRWRDQRGCPVEAETGSRWQDRLRVFLASPLLEWGRGALSRFTPLDAGVVALALVSIASLGASTYLGVSLRELRVVILEPILLYVLLRNASLDRRAVRRLVGAWILASVLISLWGLHQYAFTEDVIVAEGVRRIRSVYASPNNLSLFLGRVIPLLAVSILDAGSGWRRAAYIGALIPIAGCLYFTYSRGAWLLAVPAALLFIGLVRGGKTLWALLGAATAALLGLVPVLGGERVRSLLDFREGTTFTRVRLWQAAWNMIQDHPLRGVGLDNFLYLYPQYMLPEAWKEPHLSHPHNTVLDYWTRLGLAGVAVALWLQWGFFWLGWKVYRRAAPWSRTLALGLMASMVGFLAHGLVDNSYFLVDLAFIFFLTAGIVGRLGSDRDLAGSSEAVSG